MLMMIIRAIALQKAYIERKTERGLLRRTLEASDDAQDVVRALRSIASLVDLFTVCSLIHHMEELRHSTGDTDGYVVDHLAGRQQASKPQ
jgi:hypothetical protein